MPGELTAQQRQAVGHRATSVILASGAGCGKTHVLTARYLYHLEHDGAAIRQIAAITFTERAAREMRERIRARLETREDAAKHLRELETAPIATFHSFCSNILRQFAIPAGLDPAFEVLDDVLSANLRAEAINFTLRDLLSRENHNHPTVAALRDVIVLFGYQETVKSVASLLLEIDRPAWQEWLDRPPEAIASTWLNQTRKELLPGWAAYLAAVSPKIARCLTLLREVKSSNPEVMYRVNRLLAEVPRLHEADNLEARVGELTELAKVKGTSKKDWQNDELYERVKDALEDFRSELPKKMALFCTTAPGTAEAARTGQHFLRVALAVDDEYRQRKGRAGVLDFHDLLTLTRDLLKSNGEVRKSLQQRYKFLLLDELQDTDAVQLEVVDLLVGTRLDHDKLFAVGDHKQSIYRFRGADVKLFQELRRAVPVAGRLGLSENFRSQPGILHFVNALFSQRMPDYESLVPHLCGVSDTPAVEFLWSVLEDGVDQANGRREPTATQLRTAEANGIARRIAELLADSTPRIHEGEGVYRRLERKDIAILFRSMTSAPIYESALRRHGLDYYLVGGRAFFAQQEVYDLLNVLRAVENPQDSTSLVGALRAPFFGLSDESIFQLATHPDGPWAGLNEAERIAALAEDEKSAARNAAGWLNSWRQLKDRLPIAALLNRIMADCGYDAALQFEFMGERKLANLWKLIELARAFDRSGLFGMHEFTARLGDLVARQPREEQAATLPENADVVRLMSIHQAKGLEFPVVIVPDIASQTYGERESAARWHRGLGCLVKLPEEFAELPPRTDEPGTPDADVQPFSDFADTLGRAADQLEDWHEDLRILYVACTRSRDLLILSAGLPSPPRANERLPANHWTLTLEERFDPQTGRCLADDIALDQVPRVHVTVFPPQDMPQRAPEAIRTPRTFQVNTTPRQKPTMVSLAALEALARGEPLLYTGTHYDTETGTDRWQWRLPREQSGPLSEAEALLWSVLERWDFAQKDAWVDVLESAEAEAAIKDEIRPLLDRFTRSHVRTALAEALEVHRSVEFMAATAELADSQREHPSLLAVTIRGLIDFLYRDQDGWHILGIDWRPRPHDPWLGRQAGLLLAAWVIAKQFNAWPRTIQLLDLSTGEHLSSDPRELPLVELTQKLLNDSRIFTNE